MSEPNERVDYTEVHETPRDDAASPDLLAPEPKNEMDRILADDPALLAMANAALTDIGTMLSWDSMHGPEKDEAGIFVEINRVSHTLYELARGVAALRTALQEAQRETERLRVQQKVERMDHPSYCRVSSASCVHPSCDCRRGGG